MDTLQNLSGIAIVFALIVLVFATILMPLYVIHIAHQVDKMRRALEKLVWHAENRSK